MPFDKFLDDIGASLFPVELDAHMVLTREMHGVSGPEKALSQQFTKDFVSFVTDLPRTLRVPGK